MKTEDFGSAKTGTLVRTGLTDPEVAFVPDPSSLDELPMLLNVIAGSMSLVGPRPVIPNELEYYGSDFSLLLSVPPGVTGYSQILLGRTKDDLEDLERAALDLMYVREASILTDLKLLLQTIPATILSQVRELR